MEQRPVNGLILQNFSTRDHLQRLYGGDELKNRIKTTVTFVESQDNK